MLYEHVCLAKPVSEVVSLGFVFPICIMEIKCLAKGYIEIMLGCAIEPKYLASRCSTLSISLSSLA